MKSSLLSVFAIFSLFLFSCKEDAPVVTPASEITTNSELLNIKTLDGYQSLAITSTKPWTASSAAKWCTLSDSVGTGNKSLVVQCENNLSGVNRQANITITAGDQSKTVVVKQSGGTVLLDENFNDNSKSWSVLQNDSMSFDVLDGFYKMTSGSKSYSYYVGSKSLISNYTGSYMITYKYKYVAGKNGFGFQFGKKDNDNYYILFLYPSGSYRVYKQQANVDTLLLSGTSTSVTYENSVTLLKNGSFCTLYVNDTKVDSFDFSMPFGAYVNFYLSPITQVNVDSYKIVQF